MQKNSEELQQLYDEKLTQVRERMIFLLDEMSPDRGRYAFLEKVTGISGARWQNLFLRRLYPTLDMLFAVQRLRQTNVDWMLWGWGRERPGEHAHMIDQQEQPDEESWKLFKELQEVTLKKAALKAKKDGEADLGGEKRKPRGAR